MPFEIWFIYAAPPKHNCLWSAKCLKFAHFQLRWEQWGMDLIPFTTVSQVTCLFPSPVIITHGLKRNSQMRRLLMIILALEFTSRVFYVTPFKIFQSFLLNRNLAKHRSHVGYLYSISNFTFPAQTAKSTNCYFVLLPQNRWKTFCSSKHKPEAFEF